MGTNVHRYAYNAQETKYFGGGCDPTGSPTLSISPTETTNPSSLPSVSPTATPSVSLLPTPLPSLNPTYDNSLCNPDDKNHFHFELENNRLAAAPN